MQIGIVGGSNVDVAGARRTADRDMRQWKWGVNQNVLGQIGSTKIKVSLQDMHLVLQICSFATDSIMSDGVAKL